MNQDSQQWIGTLISFGVLAIVLSFRMRRARQAQRLRVERLWMLPAFYAAIVALLYYAHPPHGIVWLYALGALLLGCAAGWYRGKLMTITVDPETHEVSQQGSMLAMLFILVIVGIRYGVRSLATGGAAVDPSATISLTDVLLAFGFGFIAVQRLEMGLRAHRLLVEAKGKVFD